MQHFLKSNEVKRSPRQVAILAAAIKVFLQFGFRKASMEDVATAARVSRQTLYLHFRDKDQLFRAALESATEEMRVSLTRLTSKHGTSAERLLMNVFEILCGDSLAPASRINAAELVAVARAQEEGLVTRFEAEVRSVIADILTRSGTATRWERHHISAQDLANHLLDCSAGAKSAAVNVADYKRRMARAIRIIIRGVDGRLI